MNILDAVPKGGLAALDTVVWIYEFEAGPVSGAITNALFRDGFGTGRFRAACSLLVLGELLVRPLSQERSDLVDTYRNLIRTSQDLIVWDVGREIIETAAVLRAKYTLKMLDAVHVASAVVHHADCFITNDQAFRRVQELPILMLADFLPPPS